MPSAARRLAFRVLLDLEGPRLTLGDLLAATDIESLPPRERAFLHELTLGTLRHRGALDHALAACLDRPLERLDPPVRAALRLGAYQILRLRVPDRAAVSEAVDLIREASPPATGLVNAVLRRLARAGSPPAVDPRADPLGWLTTEGSLPRWLAERWLARRGAEAAVAWARALLDTPPSAFRLNPRLTDALARVEAAGLSPKALIVPGAWEATTGRTQDLASEGVLYLQDQASQMVARLAAQGSLVLDACAAPGGKSTLMADVLGPTATVVAAELSPSRLRAMASLVARWGSDNVRLVGADARKPPFLAAFDAVLLDAPCTGLGTLGRRPDIRWRLAPRDLDVQSRRQREMIESLWGFVKPGGVLVYSTCSIEPEENEGVVGPFLAAHPEFAPDPLPSWATPFAEGSYLRTRPERDRGDAFFAARLRRGS